MNQNLSPLLQLPAELRYAIYSYLDLGGHTIEVQHESNTLRVLLDKTQSLDRIGPGHRYSPLSYRLESPEDEPRAPKKSLLTFGTDPPEKSTKPRRCVSVQGLFPLALVCQQLRQDVTLLLYKLNTFSFSYHRCNYIPALESWVASLTAREKAAVTSICWPTRQARGFQHTLNGRPIPKPDVDCSDLLRQLTGLQNVVLRSDGFLWGGPISDSEELEFDKLMDGYEEAHIPQLEWHCRVSEFLSKLAELGMRKQLNREDVKIQSEQTWRASF